MIEISYEVMIRYGITLKYSYRQNQMLVRMWNNKNSHSLLRMNCHSFSWEGKMVQSFWKTFWQFINKIKHILTMQLSNQDLLYLRKGVENL